MFSGVASRDEELAIKEKKMQVVTKRIAELKHIPGNTRLHSEKQIREYIRSIEMFGQLRPMVIDENNVVLAGNGLLMALQKMGKETAACHIVAGLTENEKRKLMLADNKIAALGEEDQFAFEETLRELSGDIDIPGYGADILKNLASDLKVIDSIGEERNKTADKKTRKSKSENEILICPNCGCKIERKVKCPEKQNAPANLEVARD